MKNCQLNFSKNQKQLLDSYLHKENNNDLSDDDFIRQIVDIVREEFDGVAEGDRKTFLHLLTRILAVVLSVKTDSIEKIISLVKLTISKVITWSEQNQFQKEQ